MTSEANGDEYVFQTQVLTRPGIDERAWIEVFNTTRGIIAEWHTTSVGDHYFKHGHIHQSGKWTLIVRCRRKDLPTT